MTRGALAEELIALACRRLEQQGRAFIRQTHPATGQDVQGRRYFRHAGACDFFGFLPGGRGIMFDLKSTRTGRFSWPDRSHSYRTKVHQIEDLVTAGRDFGVLSGLIVLFWGCPRATDPWDRLFWVSWQHAPRVADSQSSWRPERLAELGMAVEAPWPAAEDPDFLGAALAADPCGGLGEKRGSCQHAVVGNQTARR